MTTTSEFFFVLKTNLFYYEIVNSYKIFNNSVPELFSLLWYIRRADIGIFSFLIWKKYEPAPHQQWTEDRFHPDFDEPEVALLHYFISKWKRFLDPSSTFQRKSRKVETRYDVTFIRIQVTGGWSKPYVCLSLSSLL